MIFLVFFHTFGYILASIVRLVQHRRVIRTEYSNVENRDLRWLSNLLILNAVLCVSWIVNTCTGHTWLQWPDALLTILSVFLLSFRGIRQNRVGLEASTSMGQQAGFPLELKSSRKYERSGLDDQQAIVYLTQLTKLMEEEKLYQNGELTLTELASRLAISPHHLSQLLNEKKGQSFYDYVNAYRVEEVKANLMDSRKRHLSLLAIALEAGFNSKTAFNTVFKKSTGLSPSEYRNQHQSAC
jgi:AraC-like DNA-binding protein